MRYKITARSDDAYRDLVQWLPGRVKVYVTSPRRRTLGTGDIPARLRSEVTARGGRISEDRQYALEGPARPARAR